MESHNSQEEVTSWQFGADWAPYYIKDLYEISISKNAALSQLQNLYKKHKHMTPVSRCRPSINQSPPFRLD